MLAIDAGDSASSVETKWNASDGISLHSQSKPWVAAKAPPAKGGFCSYLRAGKYADAMLKLKSTDGKVGEIPAEQGASLTRMESQSFEIPEIATEAQRTFEQTLEGTSPDPNELHRIALEAREWEVSQVAERAVSRLLDLLVGPAATDQVLGKATANAFSFALETVEPTRAFGCVCRFLKAKAQYKDHISPDVLTELWNQVPFDFTTVSEMQAAMTSPTLSTQLPYGRIFDGASLHAATDPTTLKDVSSDFLLGLLRHTASSPKSPLSGFTQYLLVRNHVASNPKLPPKLAQALWGSVPFHQLEVDELETVNREGVAPDLFIVDTLFTK
ncbi:hypothetical protein HDU93_009440 [Gonapodya sp. JEL0774]|nr:hypothetical protein HDU93_009440 [Gonapodya sp. JEL0774]